MAMNATRVTLNVHGVNKTGKVFKEIAASAGRVGKVSALAIGGGIVAAGAAFAATAKSLGTLSDQAARAGVSADEITKLSAAMDVLGVKASSPDMLAAAFQKMAKSIGETGLGGFKNAIGAISQLATVEERSAAAMGVFGKAGLEFMPLIEAAAKNGTQALNDVIEGMPGISQAAADAGDSVADSMSIITNGVKALWSNAVGHVCDLLDKQFAGGVREASMRGVAYMEYFAKVAGRYVVEFFSTWSQASGGIQEGFRVALSNMLKMAGGFVRACFESIAAPLRKVFESVADYGVYAWKRLFEGKESADAYMEVVKANSQTVSELALEPWKNLAKDVRGLEWFPKGTEIKLDDLKAELEGKLSAAAKAAASYSSAAVSLSASNAAGETAGKISDAARAAKNDFIAGDSYKAATMSIRADYGKNAEKTVKAVDRVRGVVEKISNIQEKIGNAIMYAPTV